MKNMFSLLCDEIWFEIACCCSTLKEFVRFWISCPSLLRHVSVDNKTFWISLVDHFLFTRGLSMKEMVNRLGLVDASGIVLVRQLFSVKKCSRSGCYTDFCEFTNGADKCLFHPGRLRATGYLSCCRSKGFKSVGCKAGYHDGMIHNMVHLKRSIHGFNETENETSTLASSTLRLPSILKNSGETVNYVVDGVISKKSNQVILPQIG